MDQINGYFGGDLPHGSGKASGQREDSRLLRLERGLRGLQRLAS